MALPRLGHIFTRKYLLKFPWNWASPYIYLLNLAVLVGRGHLVLTQCKPPPPTTSVGAQFQPVPVQGQGALAPGLTGRRVLCPIPGAVWAAG